MRIRIGIFGGVGTAAAATLFAIGGPSISAQQASGDQTPSFRSGVEVVTVDVGVVDKQGRPLLGLTPADFVVTVAGQPRHVVTAEYVDRTATVPSASAPRPEVASVSTNEGGGAGRLFAFIVDQNTLDLGSARRVAGAAGPFFANLTFADRSALMLMPLGPNVAFTWAHDRVREGLKRVTGMGRPTTSWEYGSLADARDITNRNQFTLRTLGERECGSISASAFGGGGSSNPGSGMRVASGRTSGVRGWYVDRRGDGRRRDADERHFARRRRRRRWRRRRWRWRWRRRRLGESAQQQSGRVREQCLFA